MRTLAVVCFFIAIPLAEGLPPVVSADAWRAAGLDRTAVDQFFGNSVCAKDERSFAACQAAVKIVAPEVTNFEFGDSAKKFEFAKLVRLALERTPTERARAALLGRLINLELASFDAHAHLLPRAEFSAAAGTNHPSIGIGVDFEITGAGTLLRRVYPGTPAESAGLRVGDRILQINGDTVGFGVRASSTLALLSRPSATDLDLKILRLGHVIKISLRPRPLELAGVLVEDLFPRTRHVMVRNFGLGVCDRVAEAIRGQGGVPAGVVLDLRNNPGGDVGEAACVFSLFVDHQTFVIKRPLPETLLPKDLGLTMDFDPSAQDAWRARLSAVQFADVPLVVLVNGASASASEMLASALQDASRAWIVGQRTFGKGTTQGESRQVFNPELNLFYTVSRFYRPHGEPLQVFGVTPNFVVPFHAQGPAAEQVTWREPDWYPGALGREDVPPWQDPRAPKAAKARTCANSNLQRGADIDGQLRFALALSNCAT